MKKLYLPKTIKTFNKRFYRTVIFVLSMGSVFLASCEEDEGIIVAEGNLPVLGTSTSEVELNQRNANNAAITFTWSSGTNHRTNSAIDYTVQMDRKGNNFESPVNMELGRAVYSRTFNVADLNKLLTDELNFPTGSEGEIEVRVRSATVAPSIEPDFSNIVTVAVTPYEPVTSTLYLIGDATPNGWSADNATEMEVNPNDPTTFIYQGQLLPGNFKFITTLGQFLPSYNKGAGDSQLVYRTEDAQPDGQFTIAEGGDYTITVNLAGLTISMEKMEGPPYTQLWVVGSATPKEWDLDNADMMGQSQADPFIFTYNGILKAGELKIATAKNWDALFYRPTIANAPITSTDVQLSAGDPDNKWIISEAGAYKISLNLRETTISIAPFEPYTQLWIVGDATPNGWNIDNPNEMVADPGDPYTFTYTGPLNAGEFKIPTATGNWGTDYFMPVTNHQDISLTDVMFVPGGNPDNKWLVPEAGNYTVTLNQLYHTILIERN